ncbi:DAK2 domain-containing protein [Mesorhizobium dulcispinae]|uniref:DAK2 domain-containing protein n=1 Tax=Mesorhizobium dulcispinae TaxID=3072316 RepID=UPI002A244B0C|nr:DAK2 domain-containing protein [Mesorhizobium sp. VK23D]MDX8520459.1 DAK2 domain-containing protein [Mesorhizobium sp. VK23D]
MKVLFGAFSGPLYATALLRAAGGPRASMPSGELRTVIAAMRDGIVQPGKAEPGQKTMLDAWAPAADAAIDGQNADAIAAAAHQGAEATRDMIATVGRAAHLGERSLGHPDPGSVSAAMLVEEICNAMKTG